MSENEVKAISWDMLAEKNDFISAQAAQIEAMKKALRDARGQIIAFAIPQIGAEAATKAVFHIDSALSTSTGK